MSYEDAPVVNWTSYTEARTALGGDFIRILGYFREDGTKSVAAIEDAMRDKDATRLVLPAHTLKGESYQFGAEKLALLAEVIEIVARKCVEHHDEPSEIIGEVVGLRRLFEETMESLESEANPLVERNNFGRKQVFGSGGFGRR